MKTYSRSHANRGAGLERLIDMTNKQYRNKGIADIRKIPTPVKIMGNKGGRVNGFVTKGEWVDYVGVHDGQAIIFDVKETNETTRFPLQNISDHQYELLKSWNGKGARAFLLISFAKRQYETYLLPFWQLETAWKDYKGSGRKSIPYSNFLVNCELVKSEKGYILHYLKAV